MHFLQIRALLLLQGLFILPDLLTFIIYSGVNDSW